MSAWVDMPDVLPPGGSTGESIIEDAVRRTARSLPGVNNISIGAAQWASERLTGMTRPLDNVDESVGEVTNPQGDLATLWGGSFDAVYDAAVEQPSFAEDSADIVGPSLADVADVAVQTDGEGDAPQERWMLTAVLVTVVVGVALWLLGPFVEAAATVAGGDEDGA